MRAPRRKFESGAEFAALIIFPIYRFLSGPLRNGIQKKPHEIIENDYTELRLMI